MDILSIIGVTIALVAIVGGQITEGGHVSSLLNLPAAIIVLGGTFGATLLQTHLSVFLHAFKHAIWVFRPPKVAMDETIQKIVEWSNMARRQGLLGLEEIVETESDPFIHKGLQLLVDGNEPEAIRKILEVELQAREHHDLRAAKVFESMGGYAPTIGIIGAVLGLIHVMENLTDPSKLGSGIASAFVATVYGVGLANLLFLPFSNKLKSIFNSQSRLYEMVLEGLLSIAKGENPRNIQTKLQGFL